MHLIKIVTCFCLVAACDPGVPINGGGGGGGGGSGSGGSGGGGGGSGMGSGQFDANGVAMLLPTDPTRVSWSQGDPNNDRGFLIDGDGSPAALQADGSYLYIPRTGGLASGGTQLTLRLHVIGTTAPENFSSHAELRARGYMTNDSAHEIGDQEMTGYFRLADITDASETITKKIRGGRHSSGSASLYAACVGPLLRYDGNGDELFEKELFHPTTPKFAVTKLYEYGTSILDGRWIGDKITSVRPVIHRDTRKRPASPTPAAPDAGHAVGQR